MVTKIIKIAFTVCLFLMISLTMVHANAGETSNKFNWNKAYFFNFYGVCPFPSGEVWVVGSKGMICAYNPDTQAWVIQDSGFSRNLYDVSFSGVQKGWVTGQNGLILHTDNQGETWATQVSGTTEHLFGVSFPDPDKGWVVGSYGTILHTANGGNSWEKQGDQVDQIYNDVSFTDTRNGWIVGEFGVILHTADGGKTWVQQENPLGEKTLFSVYFKDPLNGYASGMDGAILQTRDGGETWVQFDSHTTENLFCITSQGDTQWAVGLKGTYTKQATGAWQEASDKIPTRAWLKQCTFVDAKNGWVVGSVGTVLHTTDGGESWLPASQRVKE